MFINSKIKSETVKIAQTHNHVQKYRENCEKRCRSGIHKQCKTLFKYHIVRLKIISLYIYKGLRLKT